MSRTVTSRQRRRQIERSAAELRVRGRVAGWTFDQVVDMILAELPEVLPLEAHRLALGWSRRQVSGGIDALREGDGEAPLRLETSVICAWEHAAYRPRPERREYLVRLYRAGADRLGLAADPGPGDPRRGATMEVRGGARPTASSAWGSTAAGAPTTLLVPALVRSLSGTETVVYEPWLIDADQRERLVGFLRRLGGRRLPVGAARSALTRAG